VQAVKFFYFKAILLISIVSFSINDSCAQYTFRKAIPGMDMGTHQSACEAFNSGIILSTNNGLANYIYRFDEAGNLVWLRSYLMTTTDPVVSAITKTNDWSYMCAGWYYDSTMTFFTPFLLKIDSSGNVIWSKSYTVPVYASSRMDCIIQTADSGYVISGSLIIPAGGGFGYFDSFILKVDFAGTVEWNRIYNNSDWDEFTAVVETGANNLIVAGLTNGGAGNDILYACFSGNGILKWVKKYATPANDALTDIKQYNATEFITAGYYDGTNGDSKLITFRFDSTGTITHHNMYGYPVGQLTSMGLTANYIHVSNNGDVIFSGEISDTLLGNIDGLLMHIDSVGTIKYKNQLTGLFFSSGFIYENNSGNVFVTGDGNGANVQFAKTDSTLRSGCQEINPFIIEFQPNLTLDTSFVLNDLGIILHDSVISITGMVNVPNILTNCNSVGIETEAEAGNAIDIFPNPADGIVTINYLYPQNKPGKVELYDLSGKMVFQKNFSENPGPVIRINTTIFSKGIYIVKFCNPSGALYKKLIIQ